MHEIILIEKFSKTFCGWKNLIADKRIQRLSVEQIINRYQGFEGEVIMKLEDDSAQEFIEYGMQLKSLANCSLLHLVSNEEEVPLFVQQNARKVGYDVGVCGDWSVYSSIFNEVLFGHHYELVVYKDFLNDNLLFQDKSLARTYVDMHDQLSAQGKGVEDWMEMTIYEVWKQKD